ncbi:hypothetical protein BO71DRAFT_181513 [Aspergillus ellipticus CBS 707.79]|uniref:Secreted protein n=1 Tax=Aspergillus ellipticus CBS 707.79 TaxID=1448320 RepID=A0A319DG79_9EURO|nr:hypothetical protein BO71DRAFT_181513 [Aspergillus ellipticus CBS 707.79]
MPHLARRLFDACFLVPLLTRSCLSANIAACFYDYSHPSQYNHPLRRATHPMRSSSPARGSPPNPASDNLSPSLHHHHHHHHAR